MLRRMDDRTTLEPLTAPRSLAEDAADRIREQILSGGFGQGAHLVEVFDRYVPTLRALLRLDGDVLGSLEEVSRQHRPLVEAIAAGDEDKAARLFAAHAEIAGDLIAGVVALADAE